jgi:hypothetical protein
MYRIVTLFGKVLDPVRGGSPYVVLDVLPDLGDAREFGIAGQVRLVNRQISEIHYDPGANGKDIVRLPEQVARSLGKQQPPPKRRRGK